MELESKDVKRQKAIPVGGNAKLQSFLKPKVPAPSIYVRNKLICNMVDFLKLIGTRRDKTELGQFVQGFGQRPSKSGGQPKPVFQTGYSFFFFYFSPWSSSNCLKFRTYLDPLL